MNRRVVTTVSCVGVAIQGIFFAEYHVDGFEEREHIFSGIRREAQIVWDRHLYGIDTSIPSSTSTTTTTTTTQHKAQPPPSSSNS